MDRLSRSLHFTGLLARSEREGWSIVCLDPEIDTTTPNGRLAVHVLVAVSQWERETISQRTREGALAEARPTCASGAGPACRRSGRAAGPGSPRAPPR